MKKIAFYFLPFLLLSMVSCKVEFSPNAEWKDVPVVYCVLDPDDDTVWARVQRCYLSEGNLYQYATVVDSNNYPEGEIGVHLLAWRGLRGSNNILTRTDVLMDRWILADTLRYGKPEGGFAGGSQPIFYCVPNDGLERDSNCIFQLVVLKNSTGDTLAQSYTTLVGYGSRTIRGGDTIEEVLTSPNGSRGREFGYRVGCRGELRWNTIPRGRRYQPTITFFYRKRGDTLSVDIPGSYVTDPNNNLTLSSSSITQNRFLSYIKNALRDNTDTLYTVNNVDVNIAVCNEDLNAYLNAQEAYGSAGNGQLYTNIEGGIGIFGSRRSHITVNVPCDSIGKPGYLPQELINLHVGFYGNWGE